MLVLVVLCVAVMAMDALPDELLLAIFSRIEDGLTLLDAVPLVSRRWLRVSHDVDAWAGVQVNVRDPLADDASPAGPSPSLGTARVLLHAPQVRSVMWHAASQVGLGSQPHAVAEHRAVLSALRRSRTVVREFHFQCSTTPWNKFAGRNCALLGLLMRNRDHLRALTMVLPQGAGPTTKVSDAKGVVVPSGLQRAGSRRKF